MKITEAQVAAIADTIKANHAAFRAFIEVESNGVAFSPVTGKIIIQFEPSYFKKTYPNWKSATNNTVWLNNGVGNQTEEWKAFNDAFSVNPDAAMKSCSIGLGQVMGFHYAALGFKTVGEMWDFAKGYDPATKTTDELRGEYNQVVLIARFCANDSTLLNTLRKPSLAIDDFDTIARHYNGNDYKALAVKIKREPYDKTMFKAYQKFLALHV